MRRRISIIIVCTLVVLVFSAGLKEYLKWERYKYGMKYHEVIKLIPGKYYVERVGVLLMDDDSKLVDSNEVRYEVYDEKNGLILGFNTNGVLAEKTLVKVFGINRFSAANLVGGK